MDVMRKYVAAGDWCVEEIVKIVNMHVSIGKTATRSDVEISNDLVYPETTFNATSLFAL